MFKKLYQRHERCLKDHNYTIEMFEDKIHLDGIGRLADYVRRVMVDLILQKKRSVT